jgi:DNA-binding response OmpR family regulator
MERRLLMIDDDIALGKLVQEFLTSEGWSCYWVDNGEEGYQEALALKPDVILLDLNLPGVGGMELCHRMKGDPRLSHIPIVILTGAYKEVRDRVRGLERGADDYILKPFDLDILLARLNSISRVKGKVA